MKKKKKSIVLSALEHIAHKSLNLRQTVDTESFVSMQPETFYLFRQTDKHADWQKHAVVHHTPHNKYNCF